MLPPGPKHSTSGLSQQMCAARRVATVHQLLKALIELQAVQGAGSAIALPDQPALPLPLPAEARVQGGPRVQGVQGSFSIPAAAAQVVYPVFVPGPIPDLAAEGEGLHHLHAQGVAEPISDAADGGLSNATALAHTLPTPNTFSSSPSAAASPLSLSRPPAPFQPGSPKAPPAPAPVPVTQESEVSPSLTFTLNQQWEATGGGTEQASGLNTADLFYSSNYALDIVTDQP